MAKQVKRKSPSRLASLLGDLWPAFVSTQLHHAILQSSAGASTTTGIWKNFRRQHRSKVTFPVFRQWMRECGIELSPVVISAQGPAPRPSSGPAPRAAEVPPPPAREETPEEALQAAVKLNGQQLVLFPDNDTPPTVEDGLPSNLIPPRYPSPFGQVGGLLPPS